MAYSKQTWDTTSYVNPTRMNHIEDGIADIQNPDSSSWLNNNVFRYNKVGNIVWIRRGDATSVTANSWVNFGTLPSGYRPSTTIQMSVVSDSGITNIIQILNDGTCKFYSTTGYVVAFCLSFPTF